MRPRATRPQLAAVGILSVLALAVGILLALLGTDPETRARAIDIALAAWFGLTVPSVAYVAWDALTNTPQPVIMKWGWLLMTLYTGPAGAALYVLSCQEPAPGGHEQFVRPLWKQGLVSTIHCVAGDATGIIASAVITSALGLPMWLDLVVEYLAGFACGLLIFQALFMRGMLGGSYPEAVRKSFLPEWLSMNGVMAGMIPIMVVLMLVAQGRGRRAGRSAAGCSNPLRHSHRGQRRYRAGQSQQHCNRKSPGSFFSACCVGPAPLGGSMP